MEASRQATLNWQATKQEKDLAALEAEVHFLETASPKAILERYEELVPEKFQKIESDNQKLKYQLGALESSLKKEEETFKTHLPSLKHALNALFDVAIRLCDFALDASASVLQPQVTPATKIEFGDYQCNNAMGIYQALKAKGSSEFAKPLDVAKRILENLPQSRLLDKKRIEIAPSGFINLRLARDFVAEQVRSLLLSGVRPPAMRKKLRVVTDYSSPNIAKEMHVGHLRSTIIGDAISNLLEFLGHDVQRVNHVGDWGTQFGMLTAHLFTKFPDLERRLAAAPAGTDSGLNESVLADLKDLQVFYKQSKERFDKDEAFKKLAHDYVVRLQAGDAATRNAWQLICSVSRREFQRIYKRLRIRGLKEIGESFYQSRMQVVVEDLRARKLLELDEGRHICWPTEAAAAAAASRAAEAQSNAAEKSGEKEKEKDGSVVPLTIVKSDGAYTYDTSDLAALRYRINEMRCDWLIYVVDSGQAVHFNGLFGAAKRAGWLSSSAASSNVASEWLGVRADHVSFGVVLGEDRKRLKSRSGETPKLVDLLDEGLTRSSARLAERGRDRELSAEELERARSAIAYGCVKYADLSHNRTNDYIFSFDKMLEDKGNTAVYLLYAYTRIRSIARNAGLKAEDVRHAAESTAMPLEHATEWRLAKQLLRFAEVCLSAADNLYPHYICDYLYELSTVFTEFYDACYCIEKDASGKIARINHERILLCEATAAIMKSCFDILGLETVERM